MSTDCCIQHTSYCVFKGLLQEALSCRLGAFTGDRQLLNKLLRVVTPVLRSLSFCSDVYTPVYTGADLKWALLIPRRNNKQLASMQAM